MFSFFPFTNSEDHVHQLSVHVGFGDNRLQPLTPVGGRTGRLSEEHLHAYAETYPGYGHWSSGFSTALCKLVTHYDNHSLLIVCDSI